MTPTNAPALADDDPQLGPWLAYARREFPGVGVVIWRDSLDLTAPSRATSRRPCSPCSTRPRSCAPARSTPATRSCRSTPTTRWPPRSRPPSARATSPSSTCTMEGRTNQCHILDYGEGGILGARRAMVYAELGLSAPPPITVADVAAAPRRVRADGDHRRHDPRRAAQPRPAAGAQRLAAGHGHDARGARRLGPRDRRRRRRQRVRRRRRRAAAAPDHRARLPRPVGQPRVGRLGPQRQPRHVLPTPAHRVPARRRLRAGDVQRTLSSRGASKMGGRRSRGE